jgi:hypothetical protein
MRWPWTRRSDPPPPPPGRAHARPLVAPPDPGDLQAVAVFTCSTCGRTDLPEAGDWDPPICVECDAAINFDAIEAEGGWDG